MQNVEKAKEAGTISVADADRMTGEAHFARAYMYYGLVKRYGGVPLIDKVQDDDYANGGPVLWQFLAVQSWILGNLY